MSDMTFERDGKAADGTAFWLVYAGVWLCKGDGLVLVGDSPEQAVSRWNTARHRRAFQCACSGCRHCEGDGKCSRPIRGAWDTCTNCGSGKS